MEKLSSQSLLLQLEEAVHMLKLVANEQRTCVEVREWLDRNYPDNVDAHSKPIVAMLLKNKDEKTK